MPVRQPRPATPVARPAIPPPQDPAPRETPSVELLEFLGEWETADGKWVDPTTLEGATAAPPPGNEGALK